MSSPTPAPWTYSGGEVIDAQGNQIAQLYDSFRHPSEDDANGVLMAVSPDLLAALHEAREQVSILQTRLGIEDTGHGTLSIIDAAIAKAEGK